jgi:hypothetical protein
MIQILITDLQRQNKGFDINTARDLQYMFILTVYSTKKTPPQNLYIRYNGSYNL